MYIQIKALILGFVRLIDLTLLTPACRKAAKNALHRIIPRPTLTELNF